MEKRLYRPGFYVSNKSIKHQSSNKPTVIENTEEVITNSTEIVGQKHDDTKLGDEPMKSVSLINTDSVSENERMPSSAIAATPKKSSIVSGIVQCTSLKATKARSNGYADVFILLGIIVGLLGVVLLVISAVTVNTYPPLSNSLFVVGLIVLVLGIILAGIGDPSIFLDVLFGILDAL